MDFSVIVVTYHSSACIAQCLESIRAQTGVDLEILVVDNRSTDGTRELLRGMKLDGLRVIENADNLGFGRANNIGFDASSGRFLFLLNPDARFAQTDLLDRLRRAMQEHPGWGIAGTRVLSEDGRESAPPAMQYPGQRRAGVQFPGLPGEIAWILGASMCIRREVYERIGGFDPGFFLYTEETDLCLRARKAGYEIGHLPELEVRHIGGTTESTVAPYVMWRRRMDSQHRFWNKHYPRECVHRLVRRELFRSTIRMALHRARSLWTGPDSAAAVKYHRYKAIRDASKSFLSGGQEPRRAEA